MCVCVCVCGQKETTCRNFFKKHELPSVELKLNNTLMANWNSAFTAMPACK